MNDMCEQCAAVHGLHTWEEANSAPLTYLPCTHPDIVIPVRPGPNEELRYTLRGIHQHLPHGTVHLIGEPPSWVKDVHVITRPRQANKGRTVSGHLIEASTNPYITESMVLFNDDMFILEPLATIPIHNRGTVRDVLEQLRRRHSNHGPWQAMLYTLHELQERGHNDPLSFELHIPFPMQKSLLNKVMVEGEGKPGWDRRTIYGAYAGYQGTTIKDVKVYTRGAPIPRGPFVSTADRAFRHVQRELLRNVLNRRSPYESG